MEEQVAVDAVDFELVSGWNSLVSGNFAGKMQGRMARAAANSPVIRHFIEKRRVSGRELEGADQGKSFVVSGKVFRAKPVLSGRIQWGRN
jgi:hypothetical protein